jgi:hypothetical protein
MSRNAKPARASPALVNLAAFKTWADRSIRDDNPAERERKAATTEQLIERLGQANEPPSLAGLVPDDLRQIAARLRGAAR